MGGCDRVNVISGKAMTSFYNDEYINALNDCLGHLKQAKAAIERLDTLSAKQRLMESEETPRMVERGWLSQSEVDRFNEFRNKGDQDLFASGALKDAIDHSFTRINNDLGQILKDSGMRSGVWGAIGRKRFET